MSATQAPLFSHPHLSEVPTTTAELLLPTWRSALATPNLLIIGIEANQGDASDVLLATLGQASLIVSETVLEQVTRELGAGQSAGQQELEAAIERSRVAAHMINLATQKLASNFYRPNTSEEKYADPTVFDRASFMNVVARTKQFNDSTPMSILTRLEKERIADIAPGEVASAKRVLRLMYDDAIMLRRVGDLGSVPTTRSESSDSSIGAA